MPLKAMYDEIAPRYATANRFGALTKSHAVAITQMQKAHLGISQPYKALDFGVGDGAFLKQLQHVIPHASFTGIDISSEMLIHANRKLPMVTIEGSAAEASQYLPHHTQDLVLAHFINAYIPIDILFREADLMTRANGHFSLITTTYESFPVAQQYLADFIAQGTLWSTVVGHYYKTMVKNTTVANNLEELLGAFQSHQFEVIAHERIEIPIVLKDIEELAQFGIEGTWFLNSVAIRMLPKSFLIQRLKRLFEKVFTFPYQDTHVIDVILAKKR
jgi:ubiquinone/menaquinone biosynthesis C-methylase UbiE